MSSEDSNEVVGIKINIGSEVYTEIKKVSGWIRDMRKESEAELSLLGNAFYEKTKPGIDALKTEIANLQNIINSLQGKSIDIKANIDMNGANDPTAMVEKLAQGAIDAANSVSQLTQQMAQISTSVEKASGQVNNLTQSFEAASNAAAPSKGAQAFANAVIDTNLIEQNKKVFEKQVDDLYRLADKLIVKTGDMQTAFVKTKFTPDDLRTGAIKDIADLENKIASLGQTMNAIGQKGDMETVNKYLAAIQQLRNELANMKNTEAENTFARISEAMEQVKKYSAELKFGNQTNESLQKTSQDLEQLHQWLQEVEREFKRYQALSEQATNSADKTNFSNQAKRYQMEAEQLNDYIKKLERTAVETEKYEKKEQETLDRQTSRYLAAQQKMYDKSAELAAREIQDKQRVHDAQQKNIEQAYNRAEQEALQEQNRLLNERLKLSKQVNNLDILSQKNTVLGKSPLTADQAELKENLLSRIKDIDQQLASLSARYISLSEDNQKAFDTRNMQAYLAWQKQLVDYTDKLSKELVKAQELVNAQSKSTLQPTSEELSAQRQITALYAEKLRYEKELKNVQVDTKAQGHATEAQKEYIQYLVQQVREIQSHINEVSRGYSSIAQSAREAYQSDRADIMAKKNYDLADAVQKVAAAEAKKSENQDVSRYKKLYNEQEKINMLLKEYNDLIAKGGTPTSAQTSAYNVLNATYSANQSEMAELERKNINEITDYRIQKEMEANQRTLDDFASAETQRAVQARKAVDERYQYQQQRYQQYLQSYTGAMKEAEAILNGNNKSGRFTNTYENRARAIKDCEAALSKLVDTEGANKRQADNLREVIQRLTKAQNDYNAALKGKTEASFNSAQLAVSNAKTSGNLRDLTAAYKELKAAMANTKFGSNEWNRMNSQLSQTKERIDQIKKAMGEMNNQQNKAASLAEQMHNKFAAAFSVAGIVGFAKKMVDIRAQFELQRIALGAILQDVDKANDVFKDIQNMALESPFSIMQLERATKQVAAFGVAAEKLKPSVKMLADISAGLGVDIDRLILVYGHIKANNALQQLHVRQFTNAGFNIAQNLADYYTELEGKMVSVADVTDRIHKKMVTFKDVEAVLTRVTSAGGMFYDMQKKQADSLWGQMQRIKDQYDLMMNEIGQKGQGAISGVLTLIRSLIKSWRQLANVIQAAAAAFVGWAAYKYVLLTIYNLGTKCITAFQGIRLQLSLAKMELRSGATAAQLFGASVKKALASTGVGLAIVALGSLVTYLLMADDAAEQLADEMKSIGETQKGHLDENIANYKTLADVVSDTTKPYSDRQEALTELKRVYSQILPTYMLEEDYIKKSAGAYTEATDAITKYYAAQEYDKKMTAIEQSKAYTDALEKMKDIGKSMMGENVFDEYVTKDAVNKWTETITKELASGKLENTAEKIGQRFSDAFAGHIDTKKLNSWVNGFFVGKDFRDVTKDIDKIIEAEGNLTLATTGGVSVQDDFNKMLASAPLDQLSNKVQNYEQKIADLEAAVKRYNAQAEYATDMTKEVLYRQKADEEQKSIESLKKQMNEIATAMTERVADSIKDDFDAVYAPMEKTIRAYADMKFKREALSRVKLPTEEDAEQMKNLDKELSKASESIKRMASDMGIKLNPELLDTAANAFKLEKNISELKKDAFASFSKLAVQNLGNTTNKIIQVLGKVNWLKKAINGIAQTLFKTNVFSDVDDAAITAANEVEQRAIQEKNDALERESQVYENAAKKFKVNLDELSKYRKNDGEANSTYAKRLKASADEAEKTQKHYQSLTDEQKKSYLDEHKITEQKVNDTAQMAEALKYIAQVYDETGANDAKEKSGGKDPVLEMWKNRVKYIEDFFKQYKESLKNFSTEATNERITEAFSKLFSDAGLDKVSGLSITDLIAGDVDDKGLVAAFQRLKSLLPAQYNDLMNEVQKKISDTSMSIDVEVQTMGMEDFKKELDELFANYNLTKELQGMGLNIDMAYMVGGTPVTLEDVKKKLNTFYREILVNQKKFGSEGEKVYKEYDKRITDSENKELQERLKNYNKYLATTYSDIAKEKLDAYKAITEFQSMMKKAISEAQGKLISSDTTDEEKKALQQKIGEWQHQLVAGTEGMKKELESKLAELDFKALMGTSTFSEIFQDLTNVSNKALDSMIDKISEIQQHAENLNFSQIRQLAQYKEKLVEAKFDNGNVKAYVEAFKEAAKYRKEFGSADEIQQKLIGSESDLRENEKYLADLEVIRNIDADIYDINENSAGLSEEQLQYLDMGNDVIREEYDATKQQNVALKQKVNNLVDANDAQIQAQKAAQKLTAQLQAIGQIGNQVIGGVSDAMKAVKGELNETDEAWIQFAENLVNGAVQLGIVLVALSQKINSTLGIIGIIATALTAVVGLFSALLQAGDKAKERQIERLKDKVEDLERAYEKLEKAIDSAYRIDDLTSGTKQAKSNIESQISYYKQMIALEEDKKSTDHDKLREYQQAIEDLDEQLKELLEDELEALGGFGSASNMQSAAEEFMSAWLDAYKETGDGLDALQDKWDDYIDNLILKQATLRIVGKRMQKLFDLVDASLAEDSSGGESLTKEELAEINARKDEITSKLNTELKDWLEQLGYLSSGEAVLSDLQQGITNITEPQAAAIEAYLNSMRFYVADTNSQITEAIEMIRAQYATTNAQILSAVKEIRDILSAFGTKFSNSFTQNSAGKWCLRVN
jgi:hypothetical protein